MDNPDVLRGRMVRTQLAPHGIPAKVCDAMIELARERFFPASRSTLAYTDRGFYFDGLGFIQPPLTAARLMQAAELRDTDFCLIIGTGLGYEAALVARLAGSGIVVDLPQGEQEVPPGAKKRLQSLCEAMDIFNLDVKEADKEGDNEDNKASGNTVGLPDFAPFDAIIVNGAISPDYCERLLPDLAAQLSDKGRLVVVVRDGYLSLLKVYTKIGESLSESRMTELSAIALEKSLGNSYANATF